MLQWGPVSSLAQHIEHSGLHSSCPPRRRPGPTSTVLVKDLLSAGIEGGTEPRQLFVHVLPQEVLSRTTHLGIIPDARLLRVVHMPPQPPSGAQPVHAGAPGARSAPRDYLFDLKTIMASLLALPTTWPSQMEARWRRGHGTCRRHTRGKRGRLTGGTMELPRSTCPHGAPRLPPRAGAGVRGVWRGVERRAHAPSHGRGGHGAPLLEAHGCPHTGRGARDLRIMITGKPGPAAELGRHGGAGVRAPPPESSLLRGGARPPRSRRAALGILGRASRQCGFVFSSGLLGRLAPPLNGPGVGSGHG